MTPSTRILLLLFFSLTAFVFGIASELPAAHAATFTVTKAADTNDGTCDSDCSLREAIIAANNSSGPDTINFVDLPGSPDTYSLTIPGTGEEQAATGDLDIRDEVTITGNGEAETIIDGAQIDRVFDMVSPSPANVSVKATFEDLTIQNGHPTSGFLPNVFAVGGNISARAGNGRFALVLTRVTVADGTTTGANGAGIHIARPFTAISNPTLKITDSTISGNTSDLAGGGIDCLNCTLNVSNTSFISNTANTNGSGFGGGGIHAIGDNKVVTISGSTFMGNITSDSGGAILLGGSSTSDINNSMMAFNSAAVAGSAIATEATIAGGTVNANLNRIAGNLGTAVANGAGTFNAENNWWGCDGFPSNASCDNVSGTVDVDPRIDMVFTAAPDTVAVGGTSTLTVDFTKNSDGATISPDVLNGNSLLMNGLPLGMVLPLPAFISGGMATGTFTATNVGTGVVSASFDNAFLTTPMTVTSLPEADLSISKADSSDPIVAGNTLAYTITVDNAGPDEAENVVVTDTLPAGVTLVSTSGCAEDPNGVPTCSLGNIASGGSAQFTVEVSVDTSTVGTITNTASVGSDTSDPDTSDNVATEDTVVNAATADLSISKTDSIDPAMASSTVMYMIRVDNNGPGDAHDVVVTDTLPAEATLVSTSGCAEDPVGVPTCSLGTITAGSFAEYTITVFIDPRITADTQITNQATVSSSTTEGNPGDETATETTDIRALADMAVGSVDTPDPVAVGEQLTYRFNVTNNGPAPATGARFMDTLDPSAGFIFNSATATQGRCKDKGATVECRLGTLTVGQTVIVEIVVTPTLESRPKNRARVGSGAPDADRRNNFAGERTTVVDQPS